MIGPGIHIKGTVTGDEDLIIQGRVEGTIDLGGHEVFIGQSGRVVADIKAKRIEIEGEVTGDVNGVEKVVIAHSGKLWGNIVAPRVTLEDGAVFKGVIDMETNNTRGSQETSNSEQGVLAPSSSTSLGAGSKQVQV
jgi:cytoskeletal protein CcmA (bactofilin family)